MPQRFDESRLAEYRTLSRKVGERIKEARIEDGYTQEDVAKPLDRSVSWLSFIEKGTNMPNVLDLISISKFLGRPLDYFISDWAIVSSVRAPRDLAEWRAMYPGEPDRAAAHEAIDRQFRNVNEMLRARAKVG